MNTIAGIVLSFVNMPQVAAISVAVGQAGVSPLTAMVLRALWPDAWDTTKEGLLNHVRILKTALECNVNTSPNEVVRIPVTYKLTTEVPFLVSGYMEENYCDFTPQYSNNGYLYNSSTISNYQTGGIFGGRVYGIRNYSDFKAAYSRSATVLEDVNTGGNTQITLQNGKIDSINKGEYHWYNFTAPTRKEYIFYTESTIDTYGEMFTNIVPALSVTGRLNYSDDDGEGRNFLLSRVLNAGETIYLRVRGYSSLTTGLYHVKVTQGQNYQTNNQTILKSDYGFEGVYYFEAKSKNITIGTDFTFQTNRLRCGYIYDSTITKNSYLTLSAKRKNAGLAFLEYYFEERVFEINFDIGLWSSNESINSSNTTIKLEYLTGAGIWKTGINFNVNSLPKSKDTLQHFTYSFATQIIGFRFIVATNPVNYNDNKGRVVIGDINIKY